ncbi:type 1 fimbrial protein [Providencia rettgeri]
MKFFTIGLFMLLMSPHLSFATQIVTCSPHNIYKGEDATVSIDGSVISVGDDAPIGTVIFKGNYLNSVGMAIYCLVKDPEDPAGLGEEKWNNGYINLPMKTELISVQTPIIPGIVGPYSPDVYETNIPGIGVSFFFGFGNRPIPETKDYQVLPSSAGMGVTNSISDYFSFMLIKTGDYSPGMIDGNLFPKIQVSFSAPTLPPDADAELQGSYPIEMNTLTYAGQLQIIKSTCNIIAPNFVVPLGLHSIGDFQGVDSYTPWQNANITLEGCSAFSPGYFSILTAGPSITGGGTLPSNRPKPNKKNQVTITIASAHGSISDLDGIIGLEPGDNTAEGIGIQLGLEKRGVISPISLLAQHDTGILPNTTTNSLQIPLFARYIQTDNTMKGGMANGAIIYTINYL